MFTDSCPVAAASESHRRCRGRNVKLSASVLKDKSEIAVATVLSGRSRNDYQIEGAEPLEEHEIIATGLGSSTEKYCRPPKPASCHDPSAGAGAPVLQPEVLNRKTRNKPDEPDDA